MNSQLVIQVKALFPSWLKTVGNRAWRTLSCFTAWQPLTARGVLATGLAIFALRTFALTESDLVANILSVGVLSLVILVAICGLIIRIILGSRLKAYVSLDEHRAFSQLNIPSAIVLQEGSIAPFFSLQVRREFLHSGAEGKKHLITGRSAKGEKRYLHDMIRFPHRGLWTIAHLRCDLCDVLGFIRYSWSVPINTTCEVSAPKLPIRPLPIIAASSRAGDEVNHSNTRAGDFFDIKPYDPSDGIKRILWKTYARSGQLVVRRPEPAIIPEGEVAVYFVGNRKEDHVAGAVLSYVQQLHENQIVVLFGTDSCQASQVMLRNGAPDPGGRDDSLVFKSPEDICHAINSNVWAKEAGSGGGFSAYLSALGLAQRHLQEVIVFGPKRLGWFETVQCAAQSHSVRLTVALVPKEVDPACALQEQLRKRDISAIERLRRSVSRQTSSKATAHAERELAAIIGRAGARLLCCESAELYR